VPQNTPILELRGRTLFDSDGEKIGKVDELYCDKEGGQPEWALVSTGLFGTRKTFLPIQRAAQSGDDALVPFAREQVKDAPQIEADRELSEEEERRLYRHYGVPYTSDGTTTAKGSGDAGETSAEDAMTRSEEELRVGTAPRERGRARLRKYVVAENVETTVPVQREEPRVEREPITDENIDQAMSGPEISEAEHEVVVREEEPVVEKRTVPKERVRLEKDTATEERPVSEDVRKERIESDRSDS